MGSTKSYGFNKVWLNTVKLVIVRTDKLSSLEVNHKEDTS